MSSIFLGIDTGGTYTDGVLLDPQRRTVLRAIKVLTTHHDLRICIAQVLDQLLSPGGIDVKAVRLVSISTTLATNAIVEGKSRPIALFLLGYDPELVHKFGFQRQFYPARYYFIQGGMDLQGQEQAPLDEAALTEQALALVGEVEAFAISSYAGIVNSEHEERASAAIAGLCDLPVVQGHHLTSRLNSIRRAATAALNAGLLSTAYDFLQTVKIMLADRQVKSPLIVVRGDGSLVSADFATRRPVEIIHSGPATSATGGSYLAGADSALIIDIGGTTTDLAIVEHGRPLMQCGVATVGSYQTSVRTVRSRSFGLGGDSLVRFDPRGLISVGPERAIPLSYLAYAYPDVKRDLTAWIISSPEKFYSDRQEYWVLMRQPRQPFTDARTNRVLELLQHGPRRMRWLLREAGARTPVQVDAGRLLREGYITRAALTPTDLLHVTGEHTPWDVEIAGLVVNAAARMLGITVEAFIESVRDQMTRTITAEVIRFLTGHAVPPDFSLQEGSLSRWLFEQAIQPSDPFLACQFQLKLPIVGIGAPAQAFLPPVARAFGTRIIFPPHYEVANAVGTVVGSILIEKEAVIEPLISGSVITGYMVRAGGQGGTWNDINEALAHTRMELEQQVRSEAQAAGAADVVYELRESELIGGGYSLAAKAIANPSLE